jgi:hypothetical protein
MGRKCATFQSGQDYFKLNVSPGAGLRRRQLRRKVYAASWRQPKRHVTLARLAGLHAPLLSAIRLRDFCAAQKATPRISGSRTSGPTRCARFPEPQCTEPARRQPEVPRTPFVIHPPELQDRSRHGKSTSALGAADARGRRSVRHCPRGLPDPPSRCSAIPSCISGRYANCPMCRCQASGSIRPVSAIEASAGSACAKWSSRVRSCAIRPRQITRASPDRTRRASV